MYLLNAAGDIILLGTLSLVMLGGFATIMLIALKGVGIIK